MARNRLEDALQAAFMGLAGGIQKGSESGQKLQDILMAKRLEAQFIPKEYKPTTMQEALEFERAKAGILKPREQTRQRLDEARLRQLEGGEESLTPSERRQQRGDTSKLVSGLQILPIKRKLVTEAETSVKNLPKGLLGKWDMKRIMAFDPENPIVEDWQKVKMVLTDATLLNTAMTKGAISDMEMKEFQKAAANDDISSVARMKPVFNKLINFLDAEEKSLKESYVINYGDKALEKVKSRLGLIQKPSQSNLIEMIAPDGTKYKVDKSEVAEARKHGWK